MLVQPIYLPEFNEAYQSTCPDGKINQYKLQHFKRTEQQHNFFRVPFSFAEKILIHRDKIYSFCLVTLSMFSLTFLQCVFKCLLIIHAKEEAKSHSLHLFDFSPLCVFKCVLKFPALEEAKSHWLHLFDFSPLCFFK